MDSFLGIVFGFVLAGALGFAAVSVILVVYERWRRGIGTENPNMIRGEILKTAVIAGIVVGLIAVVLKLPPHY